MGKQKSNVLIKAAAFAIILVAALWIFDRPLALSMLGRFSWMVAIAAAVAVFFIALFFIIRNARALESVVVEDSPAEDRPEFPEK